MINRYRMSIGSTYLDACLNNDETYKKYKDKIVMLNILHSAPEFNRTIETAGDNDGGIITRTYRQKCSVTAEFGLYIYDIADRNAVCQIIKTLASKGGNIGVNDRLGQALYNCVCEEYPEITSARDWTKPLRLTFTTYSFPYWQSSGDPVQRSFEGMKTNNLSINVPGNAPYASCSADIVAKANFPSDISYKKAGIKLVVNGYKLLLSYPFKKNNICKIDYDANNNLRVRLYENALDTTATSILDYVLPESSDKLLVKPGQANKIEIDSLARIAATIKARGAWL